MVSVESSAVQTRGGSGHTSEVLSGWEGELVSGVQAPHLHFSWHSLALKEESVIFAKYIVLLYLVV